MAMVRKSEFAKTLKQEIQGGGLDLLLNEYMQERKDLNILFTGFVGELYLPDESKFKENYFEHIQISLIKNKGVYYVVVGCAEITFEGFKSLAKATSEQRKEILKGYIKAFHKNNNEEEPRKEEIRALINHRNIYYLHFVKLFEMLINSDRFHRQKVLFVENKESNELEVKFQNPSITI